MNEVDRSNYYVGSDLRLIADPARVETDALPAVQGESWIWRSDAALITGGFPPGIDLLSVDPENFSAVTQYRSDFATQPVADLLEKLNADWEENWVPLPVTALPGMSFFGHDEAFAMIRGGHIDISVLGALEVSEKGDLANWAIGNMADYDGDVVAWIKTGRFPPAIGGAMDLAAGAKKIIVAMTHTTRDGSPKIVKECRYEITAPACVSLIVTDMAVIDVTPDGLVLREVAPGLTPVDVQEVT